MSSTIKKAYRPDGTLHQQQHYFNGKRHRDDGPALEVFHRDGTIKMRKWHINNKTHRVDGPAYESFYKDGTLQIRESTTPRLKPGACKSPS